MLYFHCHKLLSFSSKICLKKETQEVCNSPWLTTTNSRRARITVFMFSRVCTPISAWMKQRKSVRNQTFSWEHFNHLENVKRSHLVCCSTGVLMLQICSARSPASFYLDLLHNWSKSSQSVTLIMSSGNYKVIEGWTPHYDAMIQQGKYKYFKLSFYYNNNHKRTHKNQKIYVQI